MSNEYFSKNVLTAIVAASQVLTERKEEINRLNVFPVPDGDTGTNMSLTIESVVHNLASMPKNADAQEVRKTIISGALMGARGNSGVITSQILRGLCEGSADAEKLDTAVLAAAFDRAVEVAFQAVRKPVEGTILTVLRDSASAARQALENEMSTNEALESIVSEAYASVQRTPEFLPVLKENGVVDAGGFGLAIAFDAFAASLMGKTAFVIDDIAISGAGAPKVEIERIEDWEDSEYRYCNEFLVDSEVLDIEEALDFLSTMGDCELCVGSTPKFKVHVHSNHPDQVLKYFLDRGQIFEVYIHNMDMQSEERLQKLEEEAEVELKPIGFVAVAAGKGNKEILKSLGVDVVVMGGQTMNPATKDLLDAIERVPSVNVIILPNNSNIIMAANSAAELSEKNCSVVPTKSVPQSFAAMFAANQEESLAYNSAAMLDAAEEVKTGEVTTAIKDSHDAHGNPIKTGDIIGIADGSIESVGSSIKDVVLDLLDRMDAQDMDTMTLLVGEDAAEAAIEELTVSIEQDFPDLELDVQDGGQPLYPVVFSLE